MSQPPPPQMPSDPEQALVHLRTTIEDLMENRPGGAGELDTSHVLDMFSYVQALGAIEADILRRTEIVSTLKFASRMDYDGLPGGCGFLIITRCRSLCLLFEKILAEDARMEEENA